MRERLYPPERFKDGHPDVAISLNNLGELRLMPREFSGRVEVRRLMSWFNDKFFAEVTGPLTMERGLGRGQFRELTPEELQGLLAPPAEG